MKKLIELALDILHSSNSIALAHLCEFIEDCEFTRLSVRILRLLGEEGPKMPNPTKYIRYIYNRTILENAPIRAAAVSALAKFATTLDEETRRNVRVLLNRYLVIINMLLLHRLCISIVTDQLQMPGRP